MRRADSTLVHSMQHIDGEFVLKFGKANKALVGIEDDEDSKEWICLRLSLTLKIIMIMRRFKT